MKITNIFYKPWVGLIGLVGLVGFIVWLMPNGMLGFNNPTQSGSGSAPVKIKEIATTFVVPATDNFLTNASFDETPFDLGWATSTISATLTATSTASSTQAIVCEMTEDDADGCFINQVVSSTKSGLDYNLIFDARANEDATYNTTTLRIFLSDAKPVLNSEGDLEGFTQCAALDSGNWIKVNATSTIDEATDDCMIDLVVGTGGVPLTTSSYSTYNLETILNNLPSSFSSGEISVTFNMWGDSGDQVFLDNVKLYEVEYVATQDIEVNLFTNASDYSIIDGDSTFCIARFTGTTSTCLSWINGDGDMYVNKNDVCTKLDISALTTSSATCI